MLSLSIRSLLSHSCNKFQIRFCTLKYKQIVNKQINKSSTFEYLSRDNFTANATPEYRLSVSTVRMYRSTIRLLVLVKKKFLPLLVFVYFIVMGFVKQYHYYEGHSVIKDKNSCRSLLNYRLNMTIFSLFNIIFRYTYTRFMTTVYKNFLELAVKNSVSRC